MRGSLDFYKPLFSPAGLIRRTSRRLFAEFSGAPGASGGEKAAATMSRKELERPAQALASA